jgi:O-antigen ligase
MLADSLFYRFASGVRSAAARYCVGSCIWKSLSVPPRYTSPLIAGDSLIFAAAGRLAGFLLALPAAAGEFLRRQAGGSLTLNLKAPAFAAESHIVRAAAGVRVETALWLVIFYPVVDFLLRKAPGSGFLSQSWDELLLLFIVLAWPLQMALRGRITYRYTGLDLPIIVYTGVTMFLFFMRSGNVSLAVEGARVYIEYLVWFFTGSNLILNRRQFDALTGGMVLVAAVVAAVGVYQYAAGVQTPAQWVDQAESGIRTRAFSIVVSPNVLGSFLLISIPVAAARLLASRGRLSRMLCLAALAAMLACMVFTYSRAAWLALLGVITFFSLMCNPRLLIIMAAGLVAAAKLVPGIGTRLGYMLSPAYLASSQKAGRLALWKAGLDKFWQNPLFGSGFGTYGGAVAARRIPGSTYVDNFYLKTAVEGGLVGLLALLWLLFSAFRCGYDAYRKLSGGSLKITAAALLAGLLGVAMHNAVENIFEVPMMATYFWFLTGVLLSLPCIDSREDSC